MPLQSLYLDSDSLRVGNTQLVLQSNAVYVGNNLAVANSIFIGNNANHAVGLQPYGSNNALTITTGSPLVPNPYTGAIDLRVGGTARQIGMTFSGLINSGSDFGYIWYYDNLTGGYVAPGGLENGALVIGVQNDNGATASNEDVLALESSGNMYLNPGTGTGLGAGTTTSGNVAWTATNGNLYVGNNSVRYLVLHEGITANTTLNSRVSYTAGANSIQFTNASSNYIAWNTAGVAAPTTTTRSGGTKLVLFPNMSATAVDYAIGVETTHLWFSTATSAGGGFKWYANTTQVLLANTTGLFVGNGTVNTTITGNNIILSGQFTANGSNGTSGYVLSSSGPTGNVYWAPAGGGGGTSVTLVANTTDTQTFYLPLSNTSSGTWSNGVVSSLSYVPSSGLLTTNSANVTSSINVVGAATVNGALTVNNTAALGNTTITGNLVATGQTSLGGATGAEGLRIATTASAVNYVQVTGGVTGNPGSVTLSAQGSDSNTNLNLLPKGTGVIKTSGTGIQLVGATSGYVGLKGAASAGSTTYQLPAADGTNGQVLSTNGSAVLSWTTASGGGGGRVDPRVSVESNTATSVAPDISLYDMYVWNALSTAGTLTINIPSGTPLNGNKLMFRIQDDGTSGAVTLSWVQSGTGCFRTINVPLPTTTGGAAKVVYVGCIYNLFSATWDVIASGTQF